MWHSTTPDPTLAAQLALSGMAYAQGKYTPAQWEAKTGVNPTGIAGIEVRQGLCYWTPAAERAVNTHSAQVTSNWHSLGVEA